MVPQSGFARRRRSSWLYWPGRVYRSFLGRDGNAMDYLSAKCKWVVSTPCLRGGLTSNPARTGSGAGDDGPNVRHCLLTVPGGPRQRARVGKRQGGGSQCERGSSSLVL